MLGTILDSIHHKMFTDSDLPDDAGITFYWDTFFKDIETYCAPEFDKNELSDHFYDIVCGLCGAEGAQAFRRGAALGLGLVIEALGPPTRTRQEVRDDYEGRLRPVGPARGGGRP